MSITENIRKRKSRRKMAFISLFSSISLTFTVLVFSLFSKSFVENLSQITGFLSTVILGLIGIVATYMGTATFDDIYRNPNNKQE